LWRKESFDCTAQQGVSFKDKNRGFKMWLPELQTEYPIKRLEWLEAYAPELLSDYLKSPRELWQHLYDIEQRAMGAVYSMMEERGLPRYEAEAIALTDIVYPEVADSDKPRPPLPPGTKNKLKHFEQKHLNLYRR
jgi:hypothetical protein